MDGSGTGRGCLRVVPSPCRLLDATDIADGLSAHWRAGWHTHGALIRAAHAGADPRVAFGDG